MHSMILVFNTKTILPVDPDALRQELLKVHFETLGQQYGLDQSLINPAKSNLEVIAAAESYISYFIVRYGGGQNQSIIVYEWDVNSDTGKHMLKDLSNEDLPEGLKTHLSSARFSLSIELGPSQLEDMGLLLSYELARWGAEKGEGVVRGLDGVWYELNQNWAFIPAS